MAPRRATAAAAGYSPPPIPNWRWPGALSGDFDIGRPSAPSAPSPAPAWPFIKPIAAPRFAKAPPARGASRAVAARFAAERGPLGLSAAAPGSCPSMLGFGFKFLRIPAEAFVWGSAAAKSNSK